MNRSLVVTGTFGKAPEIRPATDPCFVPRYDCISEVCEPTVRHKLRRDALVLPLFTPGWVASESGTSSWCCPGTSAASAFRGLVIVPRSRAVPSCCGSGTASVSGARSPISSWNAGA